MQHVHGNVWWQAGLREVTGIGCIWRLLNTCLRFVANFLQTTPSKLPVLQEGHLAGMLDTNGNPKSWLQTFYNLSIVSTTTICHWAEIFLGAPRAQSGRSPTRRKNGGNAAAVRSLDWSSKEVQRRGLGHGALKWWFGRGLHVSFVFGGCIH